MKIRLTDNDIRLRLTEFEVAAILEGRRIVTTVANDLVFVLQPGDVPVSSLETTGPTHTVTMPASLAGTPSAAEPLIYESPSGQNPYVLIEMDRAR